MLSNICETSGLYTIDDMLEAMQTSYHPDARKAGAKGGSDDIVYTEILQEKMDWASYIHGYWDDQHMAGFTQIHHV